MMSLEEDLEREILVRLPAKSLMRFKCVQRSWNLLIKTPSFVTAWQMQHHNDRRLMILHQLTFERCITLLSFDDDPTPTRPLLKSLFPSSSSYSSIHMTRVLSYGHCNGVFCLHDLYTDQLILWNPTTRKVHVIPPPLFPYRPLISHQAVSPLFGFGADPNSPNDFKVIHLHFYNYANSDSNSIAQIYTTAQIYNLGTKSWTLIHCPDFPTDLFIQRLDHFKYNALVNGVYHWITDYSRLTGHSILCFDFRSNRFDKISAPISKFDMWDDITEINGSLAYVVGNEYSYPSQLRIWVMDQQGSWAEKYSIGPIGPKVGIHGIWKDGAQVLGGEARQLLKSYDHDGNLVREFPIKVPYGRSDFLINEYVPSIAPLSS